jgi:hypothetical protein
LIKGIGFEGAHLLKIRGKSKLELARQLHDFSLQFQRGTPMPSPWFNAYRSNLHRVYFAEFIDRQLEARRQAMGNPPRSIPPHVHQGESIISTGGSPLMAGTLAFAAAPVFDG